MDINLHFKLGSPIHLYFFLLVLPWIMKSPENYTERLHHAYSNIY